MSELSKLSSTVESLKTSILSIPPPSIDSEFEQKPTTVRRREYNEFKNYKKLLQKYKQQIINDIQPVLAKLMIKKDTKDPISGVARFGQSAVNRIINLNEQIIILQSQCDKMLNAYSSMIEKYSSMFVDDNDYLSSPAVKSNIPPAATNYQIDLQYLVTNPLIPHDLFDASSSSYVGSEEDEEKKLKLHQQQLQQHVQADELRKKRQVEIQEIYAQIHHQIEVLRGEVTALNARKRGILELPLVLSILKDNWNSSASTLPTAAATATTTTNTNTTLKTLLQNVVKILDQIIQYPDKNELRQLRVDHPLLWKSITSHSGGLLLLLVLGFELKTESNAPLSSFNLDTSSSSLSSSSSSAMNALPVSSLAIPSSLTAVSCSDNNSSNSNNYQVSEAYQLINQCSDIAKLSIALSSSLGGTSGSIEDDLRKIDTAPSATSIAPTTTSTAAGTTDISNMRLRLIMTMNEPSMDDMSAWVNWFDNLSGMKQYLETEASLL